MSWLLLAAARAEVPEDCPVLTAAADARALLDQDWSIDAELDAAQAAVWAEVPDGCAFDDTGGEQSCSDGTRTATYETSWEADHVSEVSSWSLVVEDPDGESWTRLTADHRSASWAASGMGVSISTSVSWDGPFGAEPAAGQWAWYSSWSSGSVAESDEISVTTPWCRLSRSLTEDYLGYSWWEVYAGVEVEVVGWPFDDCYGRLASVDGVDVGGVDADWELVPDDLDGDGVWGDCDCDEGDATVNAGAADSAEDGVDQDCNGYDGPADQDGDDYPKPAAGGADCDDLDADVHPGADDDAGDGVDQDCDGADDVDGDGDGWTADGDDEAADCDDADADAWPGARETGADGVDQDCDGADDVDADGDGWTADGDDRRADCDDLDPAVHPGAEEVLDDTIDQDCDGRLEESDHDRDDDHSDAEAWGGRDCDDADPAVHPGVWDGLCDDLDRDCDGYDCDAEIPDGQRPAERGCQSVAARHWLLVAGILALRRRARATRGW